MSAPLHSKLPPSSAFRWTRCTSSVKFVAENEAILSSGDSPEADEGTRAHAYLTASLKHTLGQVPDNEEMRVVIDEEVKYIHSLIEPGSELFVDQRVSLFYLKSEKGTLDVAIVGPSRIVIHDLKYGKGVSVYATDNEQLAIYAESKIREIELDRGLFKTDHPVWLQIYQPRDRNDPQMVREWIITRGQLAEFCKKIQSKADTVLLDLRTEFMPGIACKFCRATGICKAYASQGLSPIADDASVDVVLHEPKHILQNPHALSREQRQRVLKWKKDLNEWLEAVENQEVAELLNGADPLEFKLVEGKSNRQWSDPKGATTLLTQHFVMDTICPPVTPELVSPAQMEKLLKTVTVSDKFKADLYALIEKPKGKPTLVPVTDKRPALLLKPLEGLSQIKEYDPQDLI